jgi:LacI family transcriptional regulator
VLIFNSRDDAERERQGVETLLARRVDGIVFTTAVSEENVRLALEAGVATVEVEKPLCEEAASVIVDNYAGAAEAVEYLVELGHRRIGYIGEAPGRRQDRTVEERFNAYRDTLQAAGIALDDAAVVLGAYWRDPGWADIRTGCDYMERLLERSPDVTAVFAASDIARDQARPE